MGLLANDDPVRTGDALQPGSQVEHGTGGTGAIGQSAGVEVADHGIAGCDADPHGQGRISGCGEAGNPFRDLKRRADRAFWVVFMGCGIAEISQNAVADEASDGTAEAIDGVPQKLR